MLLSDVAIVAIQSRAVKRGDGEDGVFDCWFGVADLEDAVAPEAGFDLMPHVSW